jgi:PRTRC genetic system ThiF family protein
MNQTLTFDPHLNLRQITVAGVGGTGSQVARNVARILFDMRRRQMHHPRLLLVDPDIIEPGNVGRQAAVSGADAGAFKAETLARRFNYAYGLDVSWANEAYQPEEHTIPQQTLLVGCVDNHLARRALASTRNVVFLDSGNHHDAGQVLLSTGADRKTTLTALESAEKSGATAHLPALDLTFPALLEPPAEEEPEDALTCEGRVEQGQHLLVNDLVATVCAGYIYRLLHRQSVTSFLAFCDLETLAVRPIPLSRDNLLAYLVP